MIYGPELFLAENNPISDTFTLYITNPTWLNSTYIHNQSFIQNCTYNTSFATNKGLKIYLAADTNGNTVNITKFEIKYYYPETPEPTNNPTVNPTTLIPTGIPTISPTTTKPTNSPAFIPITVTPTMMSNMPTIPC